MLSKAKSFLDDACVTLKKRYCGSQISQFVCNIAKYVLYANRKIGRTIFRVINVKNMCDSPIIEDPHDNSRTTRTI